MNILIGVDETEKAMTAVAFGKSLVKRLRHDETHRVTLYRSTYPNEPHVIHRGGPTVHDTAVYTCSELAHLLKNAGLTGLTVDVVHDGRHPAEGLASLAVQKEADFIVISGQRLHPSVGLYLGSVGQRLIQLSSCPVVVVHDECPTWPADPGSLTIVVGYDGSPAADDGLDHVQRLFADGLQAAEGKHRIVLVHAMVALPSVTEDDEVRLGGDSRGPFNRYDGDPETPSTTGLLWNLAWMRVLHEARAHELLHRASAALAERDVEVETVIEEGPPVKLLQQVAEEEGGSIVVLGIQGLDGAPRTIGAVVFGMLQSSGVPLMIVPAPAEEKLNGYAEPAQGMASSGSVELQHIQ